MQGVAAILLDEDLNAVSLRLYNDWSDPSDYRVSVEQADSDSDGVFFRGISRLIEPDNQPWIGLSESSSRSTHFSTIAARTS